MSKGRNLAFIGSFGVFPMGITSTMADVGTPFGLYYVPLLLGGLIFLTWLVFVFFYKPDFRRMGFNDSVLTAEKPIESDMSIAMLFAMFISVAAFAASYISRDEGGVLASNFEIVQELQAISGTLKESLVVQKEIADTVGTLKREVSDDPAKELANLGFSMSPQGMLDAINTGNVRAVHLYADAGNKLRYRTLPGSTPQFDNPLLAAAAAQSGVTQKNPLSHVIEAGDPALAEAIGRLDTANDPDLCFANINLARGVARVLSATEKASILRSMCAGGKAAFAAQALRDERREQRNTLSTATAKCEVQARKVAESADLSNTDLVYKYVSAKSSGSFEGLSLEELVAGTAFLDLRAKHGTLLPDGTVAFVIRKSEIPNVAKLACSVMLDPTHEYKTRAALDEDLEALASTLN